MKFLELADAPATTANSENTNSNPRFFYFGGAARAVVVAILFTAVVLLLSPRATVAQTSSRAA